MTPDEEVVDAEFAPLAVREESPEPGALTLFVAKTAAERAQEMVDVAQVFVGLARQRDREAKAQNRPPLIIKMKDKKTGRESEYLTLGLWQTLGALLPRSCTAFTEWTKPIEGGYMARAIARTLDGREIAAAEAQCTRSESFWSGQTDNAIQSMAQTRALGKALRSGLGFLVVLAGFEATPAEEMPRDIDQTPQRIVRAAPPLPQERAKPTLVATEPQEDPLTRERRRMHAICKERGIPDPVRRSVILRLFGAKSIQPDGGPSTKGLSFANMVQLNGELDHWTQP